MPRKHDEPTLNPPAGRDAPATPARYRNDRARWKEHDMPDADRDRNHAVPEDYERPIPPPPRR
ncbi:hypothetical protein CSC62_00760 [Pseudoxanthomonas jiangsuensis]|uniref:hypothetical protein n=1 Tax=Pseudoxanthomonas jiangsuensis TaxID=619688 RepID=UPI001390B6A7|nr:hypothetical protein [Pseudoxanthomonas jiangsuensis]KAF1699465.1 hypothetical protein CSC62_00760 [Pseudoxanthomonas jiangsuensis]